MGNNKCFCPADLCVGSRGLNNIVERGQPYFRPLSNINTSVSVPPTYTLLYQPLMRRISLLESPKYDSTFHKEPLDSRLCGCCRTAVNKDVPHYLIVLPIFFSFLTEEKILSIVDPPSLNPA